MLRMSESFKRLLQRDIEVWEKQLPPELRDIIWVFYWDSDKLCQFHEAMHWERDRLIPRRLDLQQNTCCTYKELPASVVPDYVGALAHDAALTGMRLIRDTPNLRPSESLGYLHEVSSWLFHDLFHVGITLGHALRNVNINYMPYFQAYSEEAPRNYALSKLRKQLAALLDLPPGLGQSITLVMKHYGYAEDERIEGVVQTLEALRYVWMELKQRGVGVPITLKVETGPFKKVSNVNEYYKMSLKEWKEGWMTKDITPPAWCLEDHEMS